MMGIRQIQITIYDLLVLLVYYPWIIDKVRRLKDVVHFGSGTKLAVRNDREARRSQVEFLCHC